MFEFKDLPPFKFFCYKNFPFLEDNIQGMTYYDLLCKVVGYMTEEIVPNVNNIGNSQSEVLNGYNELKSYVDNYFNNLDVQKEINDKLDEMAKNGQLSLLLNSLYDELRNEVNNKINIFENSVNNELNSLSYKINAATSGSPLVASSTSEMTNTNRIYVNTTDGKWYYYNGSSWVAGGTYQSTRIDDNTITLFELDNLLQANFAQNYGTDIDLGQGLQGWVREVNGKLEINQQGGYTYYRVPLESGATYQFNSENNVSACGIVVADQNENVLYVNDHRGETTNVNGIFNVVGQNLFAYLGTINKTFGEGQIPIMNFKSSTRIRKLESVTNNLLIDNTIPLLMTYPNYIVQKYQPGEQIALNQSNNYTVDCYSMEKGKTYNLSAYNLYLANGFTITDNNYNILYSSHGTDTGEITPVNRTFTASRNGFIFMQKNPTHDYSIKIEYPNNIVNANIYPNISDKKIVYDGDSITEGRTNNGGSFPQLISAITNSTFSNAAVGGAYLSHRETGHSVVDNLSNLPTDGDMYVFQGGINDFWNNVPLGTITENYTDELNTSTIAGSLEQIFRYSLNNFVGKPIIFIMTHKIQQTAINNNTAGYNMSDMTELFIKICNKYSIPYYNAFDKSGLNGWNTEQSNNFLTGNAEGTGDGIHPNASGYNKYYVPQLLNIFQSNLQK